MIAAAPHTGGGRAQQSLTAAGVAEAVGGTLVGDGTIVVTGVASLDRARRSDVSFLTSAKYVAALAGCEAGVVLVAPELADAAAAAGTRVLVPKPHEAMLLLLPLLYRAPAREPGVHPSAVLGRGVSLGEGVTIGANVVLGADVAIGDRSWIGAGCVLGDGVQVGADTQLHPQVTLYAGATLGDRVILHSGARIGSDGYGYVQAGGVHQKIPHVGGCRIEDDVEIGANTTVDRGSIDETVIGAGTKIDNLVHVGHNVRIGRLCLIMAQVGIAGSARIEDGCILAGQAGIGGHTTLGRGARVGGQAGVFNGVPAGETWSGYPARPHRESMRAHAAMFRLPALLKRIERLLPAEPAE